MVNQAEALSLNVQSSKSLPSKRYLQEIPKLKTFPAVIEMSIGGSVIGVIKPAELRTADVRVHFDAGREATPRIDIIVKISITGKEVDMH